MLELESKYVVRTGQARATLRKVTKVLKRAGFLVQDQQDESFKDTYFDTSDGLVHNAGWSLRVRDCNNERLQITLKRRDHPGRDFFRREEVTHTLCRPLPPDWLSKAGAVSAVLEDVLTTAANLQPLFKQRTKRQQFRITRPDLPESVVALSLDNVTLKRRGMNYFELEFELVQGPEAVLKTITALVGPLPTLAQAQMSKYDRALFAHDHKSPINQATQSDTQTWQQLGIGYLDSQLQALEYYDPFASEGAHVEGVHQLRVATRRILAGLSAFDNVLPGAEAIVLRNHTRVLTKQLGRVRDLDVHLLDLAGCKLAQRYLDRIATERSIAHERLSKVLKRGAVTSLRADFTNLVTISRSGSASSLSVMDGFKTQIIPTLDLLERLGGSVKTTDPKQMHRLRLELKRLSYQLECVTHVSQSLVDSIGKLQDILGHYQDAQVAIERLNEAKEDMTSTIRHFKKTARRARRQFKPAWRSFVHEVKKLRRTLH